MPMYKKVTMMVDYGLHKWKLFLCYLGSIFITYIVYCVSLDMGTILITRHGYPSPDWKGSKNQALLSHLERRKNLGNDKWGVVLSEMNTPLRNNLDKKNAIEGIGVKASGLDPNLDALGRYTKQGAKTVIEDNILSEEVFRTKDNIAKLMTMANFIKETDGTLHFETFKSLLVPQNFAGERFLFQNARDFPTRLEVLDAMIKRVNLTKNEITVLQNLKPGLGDIKRKWKRFQSLNIYSKREKPLENWRLFHNQIDQYSVYKDNDVIDKVIHDLRTQNIMKIATRNDGTQVKLILTFADGSRALFKPRRIPKTQETLPDEFYFNEYERHTGEIAAFNLDRALGLHHTPPTVGRILSISEDIIPLINIDTFRRTFFESPSGKTCFYGECSYYCDMDHAICGSPDLLEGSLAAYLPSSKSTPRGEWMNPWRRSYSRLKKAKWETDPDYCNQARKQGPHGDEKRLLDIMDMTIFDFFQGNLDRHHYETFTGYDNDTSPIYIDNGRGWGRSFYDEMSILTPIRQCCIVRYRTLKKLLKFDQGPVKLSDVMRDLLASDIIKPVVLEEQLLALDRRVKIVLKEVYRCIEKTGNVAQVVINR